VASIPNIVRRGGIFHFRRMVPHDLRRRLGRTELVRTLDTGELRTARLRASELYICSEHLFVAARSDPMLTDDQLARLVQDFYAHVLDRENQVRLTRGLIPEEVRAQRSAYYATVAARSREALACNRLEEAAIVTEGMLRKQGIAPGTLPRGDLAQARQAMLRAGIDLAEAVRARYDGDFNHEPRDRLLKMKLDELAASPVAPVQPTVSSPAPPPPCAPESPAPRGGTAGPPLSEVGAAFRDTQVATGAWDHQTAGQARATFRLFVEVCGDKPLAAYTRRDVGLFRDRIQRLPNDYGKHPRYRDLSVDAILAAHAALPARSKTAVITQRTVKRHFSALSALWSAAVPKGEAEDNIFSGFRFPGAKKATEQRDMWEKEELARLFATPIWRGCESQVRRTKPGNLVLRDEKYWLPLIAVFSGLRQEEICQLHVEDVRHAEGVLYFDINNRPPRKLKNASAIRQVPLHAELIQLGLPEFVEAQRRVGHARLFPDLMPGGADGRLGHAFTKWFTRYRRDVGLYRPGLDFHSFRHSATTLMHQAGVERAVIDHVTGHTTPGETARYTKRSSLPQLKAAIDAITIGIDVVADLSMVTSQSARLRRRAKADRSNAAQRSKLTGA
jgi:integrase